MIVTFSIYLKLEEFMRPWSLNLGLIGQEVELLFLVFNA